MVATWSEVGRAGELLPADPEDGAELAVVVGDEHIGVLKDAGSATDPSCGWIGGPESLLDAVVDALEEVKVEDLARVLVGPHPLRRTVAV